jgi:acyl-CoA reductase-like NAD-dependent aldehyde dehydrogenase
MPTRKSAPRSPRAACGAEPAEQTPLSALAIAALAEEAGVPADLQS